MEMIFHPLIVKGVQRVHFCSVGMTIKYSHTTTRDQRAGPPLEQDLHWSRTVAAVHVDRLWNSGRS